MSKKTRVPFLNTQTANGLGLPGVTESVILFSSPTAFGSRCATHYECYFVDVALTATQAAGTQTVALQKSNDGGTTWITVGTPTNVASGNTNISFHVAPYQDFRILYLNGTTLQTAGFAVDLVLDHESRGSVGQA
jgi:hypothetical protein